MTKVPANLPSMLADPVVFRNNWLVNTPGEPKPLGQIMTKWQRRDFEAMDPAWRRISGQDVPDPVVTAAYLERGRGSSKTGDLATSCCYHLLSSQVATVGLGAAATKDQAKLLRDEIARQVNINGWPREFLQVDQYRVSNTKTGATLDVLAAESAQNYGWNPSYIVCDELVHWSKKEGAALWEALASSKAKRGPHCLLLVISNAGFGKGDSWQWKVRQTAKTSPGEWFFHRLKRPASWISDAELAMQQKLLPPSQYDRLWGNRWVVSGADGIGESYIDRAIVSQTAPPPGLAPGQTHPVCGVDLSLVRDRTAVVFCCLDAARRKVCLLSVRTWQPVYGGEINLQEVEDYIVSQAHSYTCREILLDPWNAAQLRQRLEMRQFDARGINPTVEAQRTQAQWQYNGFREGMFELWNCRELVRDLKRLSIHERPANQGFYLQAPKSDATGHSDAASAWMLCSTQCAIYLSRTPPPQQQMAIDPFGGRRYIDLPAGYLEHSAAFMQGRRIDLRGGRQ